jgi:hypothetical protein
MLLTVDEIRDQLRFKLNGSLFQQMALQGPGVSKEVLRSAADLIGATLSESFNDYMMKFDFRGSGCTV